MLQLINVTKEYKTAGQSVHALKGVNLRFRKNEFVSILGASGCGKTTLLNIVGGLDKYTTGDLVINGKSTKTYEDHDWDVYRNHRIGFVFQSYNLIPQQTVLGNVEIALTIAGVSKAERKRRAAEALKRVGLEKELKKRPNQLSGGQMQRVAIARALVNNPEILLADEPTGALDTETSVQIMDLIREIAGERLVIMVTHNPELAEEYSSRIVRLQDGLVIADSNPYDGGREDGVPMYEPTEDISIAERDEAYAEGIENAAKKAIENPPLTNEKVEKEVLDAYEGLRRKKRGKRAEKESSAMSFKTSLGLSAGNLAMKRGRTMITSVAGSIGIISVCLVLALSNGFSNYIAKTQEDMLSSSPLQIKESTVDVTAVMSGMANATEMPDLSELHNEVYVNSFLTSIAHGMTMKNDLSDEYLQYLDGMDEEWYEAISYSRGIKLDNNLFTEVEIENGNGDAATAVMSLSDLKSYYTLKLRQQEEKYAGLAGYVDYLGSIYGTMPGTSAVNREKGDFMEYVKSQYDLVDGEGYFPTSSNEAVLVVGGNNDVTDLTLAQLGFIGEEEFLSLFPTEGEDPSDIGGLTIPFEKIIGRKVMLNYNDAVFTEAPAGGEYLYNYAGTRSSLDLDPEKGTPVTITGVLRLKEGMNYGCLGNGLYFTEQLVEEHLEVNKNSKIAKTIYKQGVQVQKCNALLQRLKKGEDVGGELFVELAYGVGNDLFKIVASMFKDNYMPVSSLGLESLGNLEEMLEGAQFIYGDGLLRKVGGNEKINNISIYTTSFESKEKILDYLDAWNENPDTPVAKQVKYTDTVGMMMSMVEMMLDAITYVLVAFTAISLVVSSVMIGIITYVSVVERVKEIGVLRSLGARKKDIKNLFNAETFIIGLSSGVFGVAVTYLLSIGVNALLGVLTGISTLASLPVGSAIIMVVISVLLTLISGLIPANAAAKKDPVVALRTE